eukprot:TRINITY_DN2132_c0_g2_i1.p7 TRINITY_DN2132_c0_g2~~TRINITY_DN2132_c0_g2_i1.p7  ORF type:complete len:113 (+),score=2.11 TRINITY_DN2132_c0_g2_i1:583-921(+)
MFFQKNFMYDIIECIYSGVKLVGLSQNIGQILYLKVEADDFDIFVSYSTYMFSLSFRIYTLCGFLNFNIFDFSKNIAFGCWGILRQRVDLSLFVTEEIIHSNLQKNLGELLL